MKRGAFQKRVKPPGFWLPLSKTGRFLQVLERGPRGEDVSFHRSGGGMLFMALCAFWMMRGSSWARSAVKKAPTPELGSQSDARRGVLRNARFSPQVI